MMYPRGVERSQSASKPRRPSAPPAELDLSASLIRNTILTAATQVFTREGITAARVEDILLDAGVARRTFYRYFASKEDVLAALHELWTGDLLRAIEASRTAAPDEPLAGVRAGIDLFLGFFAGRAQIGTPVTGRRSTRGACSTSRGDTRGSRSGGVARAVRELVELAMRSDSLLAARRRWVRGEIVKIMDRAARELDGKRRDPFVFYGLLGALESVALELDGASDADVERARRVLHALVDQAYGVASGHRRSS
jgi:AcrR family transcriptional regulator